MRFKLITILINLSRISMWVLLKNAFVSSKFRVNRLFSSIKEPNYNYHRPVLLNECCDYLNIKVDGIYIDCTLGGGGHTKEILARGGKVIGFDQDSDAIAHSSNLLSHYIENQRLEIVQSNFRTILNVVKEKGLEKQINGVLLDLGVSSHQINEPSRGFAFGSDGPLDMRMSQTADIESNIPNTLSAYQLINEFNVNDLADILYNYGDETRSRQIARDIVLARPLNSTQDLVEVIGRITSWKTRQQTLARCFQAIRIYVNDELGALTELLNTVHNVLAPNGRLVIMSYHSLEDRLVKTLFKTGSLASTSTSITINPNLQSSAINSIINLQENPWNVITNKAIIPTKEELEQNKRSRSVKLRVAERKNDLINTSENESMNITSKYGKNKSFLGKKQLAKQQTQTQSNELIVE